MWWRERIEAARWQARRPRRPASGWGARPLRRPAAGGEHGHYGDLQRGAEHDDHGVDLVVKVEGHGSSGDMATMAARGHLPHDGPVAFLVYAAVDAALPHHLPREITHGVGFSEE
ncbi:hypothetical protein EJB05_52303, partial [Eragrostis curvula]